MEGEKKCFGLLLALFIMVGLSLSVFSIDTNALKHEYKGLNLLTQAIPSIELDSNSNELYIDWAHETDTFNTFSSFPFSLKFEGSAWDDSLSSLRVRKSIRYLHSEYNSSSNTCEFSDSYIYPFRSVYYTGNSSFDGDSGLSSSSPNISTQYGGISQISASSLNRGYYFIHDSYQGNKMCWSRNGMTSINFNSYSQLYNNGLRSFPNGNEPLIFNVLNVANNDNVFPFNYYTDTIPFSDSHKQGDGVVYTKSFSFDTIFNRKIDKFSYLSLSLDDYDGYWYDSSNFYDGRSIDFHFQFRFKNSFSLTSDFINNGSLKLKVNAVPRFYNSNSSSIYRYLSFDCTSTIQQVGDNDYYWDISCPIELEDDYIVFVPYLVIDGNGQNVLNSDGDWDFSSLYIITDHDSTPGSSFNDSPTGNSNIWDSYWSDNDNQFSPENADWFMSLTDLFSFGFLNPFAPIFQLFNDNNSCAQIPIIAAMIHSEETEVCPWFDSTTRNIVTPVLGLSSMMLLFGFAVRWLGARSGNFFEDSGSIESPGTSRIGDSIKSHGWRRKG